MNVINYLWTFNIDECTNQAAAPIVTTIRSSSSTYCTPMRGRMTAYLPSTTSSIELLEKEKELLSYIQSDMSAYTNEDISKVVYIGSRPTSTSNSGDNSVGGVIVGTAAIATPSSESASSSMSSGGGKSGISLLFGGIALFIVSIALIVMLVVYKRRRRRNHQAENDTNEGKGGRDILSRDPDDIQLLPNPDKLDLRSVHSKDSILSDADTENYSYVDDEGEEVDYIDRVIDYIDDTIATKGGSNTNIKSSELAALGMASTLITARSYMSPKSYDEEAYYEYENDVDEEAEVDLNDGLIDTNNDVDGNDNEVEVENVVDENEETRSLPHLGTVIELDNFSTMSSKEESMSSKEEYYTLP